MTKMRVVGRHSDILVRWWLRLLPYGGQVPLPPVLSLFDPVLPPSFTPLPVQSYPFPSPLTLYSLLYSSLLPSLLLPVLYSLLLYPPIVR